MRAALPLNTRLLVSDLAEVMAAIFAYACGQMETLRACMAELPLASSEGEQAFWMEELERLENSLSRVGGV